MVAQIYIIIYNCRFANFCGAIRQTPLIVFCNLLKIEEVFKTFGINVSLLLKTLDDCESIEIRVF